MKLKSKLIATIVSICAAIAVMGVGVWAATSSFSVSVSNTVDLTFQNLDGKVTVSATTGAVALKQDATAPTLAETTLFDNGQTTYSTISAAATEGTNLQFVGVDFLTDDYITADTTAAAVMYEFKYTHNSAAKSGAVQVVVTEAAPPVVTGATITTAYFVSTDGTNWMAATSGTAYTTASHTGDIYVRAIAQYTNTNGVSVTTTAGSWNFSVAYTAVASVGTVPSGTTTIDPIADGVVAIG